MKLAMLVIVLAAVVVLGTGQAAAAPADSSTATGRRLLHSSNPTSHTKSMDSWLRWLLFRSRIGEKVGQHLFKQSGRAYSYVTSIENGCYSCHQSFQ